MDRGEQDRFSLLHTKSPVAFSILYLLLTKQRTCGSRLCLLSCSLIRRVKRQLVTQICPQISAFIYVMRNSYKVGRIMVR